ncbi:MAG: bifunctional nuclease family protein, partial [Deltaproteobacteria bacterium]|nr:bifunctional nuclease family protein [Deltaproteobacteria bacterium]
MIEMTIDSIRVSLMNYQRVVILREKMAERYLPIWIGPAEADAIAVKLQGVAIPRPLTHDLLHSVIDTLGATINSIVVSDLKNDTFYAKIVLNVGGGQLEIDSRPSDALALAVRTEA